jgi:hypothetical protein
MGSEVQREQVMSKSTPGPWTWNKNYHGLTGPGGAVILDYATYEGMWVPDYAGDWAKANARLIAAAPDLLAALEDALSIFEFGDDDETVLAPKWVARARAAIAKAEGHSPSKITKEQP